jgi:protein TonB
MYAIEYAKQQRTAPAVITVAIHLALLYAVAVGLHVVPSPLSRDAIEVVTVPAPPESDPTPVEKHTSKLPESLNLALVVPRDVPTITIAQDLPVKVVDEPVIDIGPGDTIHLDEPIVAARLLRSSEPLYPLSSRIHEEEGTVILKVMISPFGTAGAVQVETSSGFPRLDEAAVKAVRGWKFSPAKRGSQAIETWVSVPVTFVLNGRG